MVKKCVPCYAETIGHLEDFDLQALPSPSSILAQLVCDFVVISGVSSLSRANHLSKIFR